MERLQTRRDLSGNGGKNQQIAQMTGINGRSGLKSSPKVREEGGNNKQWIKKMEGGPGQQDARDRRERETRAFVIHYSLCTEQLNRVADMHLLIEMT